jgi:hypothetical protein
MTKASDRSVATTGSWRKRRAETVLLYFRFPLCPRMVKNILEHFPFVKNRIS